MWLFSDQPEHPESDKVMEKHSAEALYSTVKRLMPAIPTEDNDGQQDAAHRMIKITKPWTITRWSVAKLTNGRHHVPIPKENAHHIHLEWTEEEQAELKTSVES